MMRPATYLERTDISAAIAEDALRVWIVDDNDYYRDGLAFCLNHESDMICCGNYQSCESALTEFRSENERPDVILLDLAMPGIGGMQAISRFKEIDPRVYVLILTEHEDAFAAAMFEGADGFLLKSSSITELMQEIRVAIRQANPIDPAALEKHVASLGKSDSALADYDLTRREMEILQLRFQRFSVREIAERLVISPNTIRTHLKSIHQKLQCHTGSELRLKAIRERLL